MGIPIESTNYKRALRQIRQDASVTFQENLAIIDQIRPSVVLSPEEACDLAERALLVVIACGGLTCSSEWAAVSAIVKLRQSYVAMVFTRSVTTVGAREANNGR